MQLQKDGDWETRVDAAFAKLDSNGDGYIDLEELLAQLPFETEESYDGERLMEVILIIPKQMCTNRLRSSGGMAIWSVKPWQR